MKAKIISSITLGLMLIALQSYEQTGNTTYGGSVQDATQGSLITAPGGNNNTGFGYYVFSDGNTSNAYPVATTGNDNTAVGYETMYNATGGGISGAANSALGSGAMYGITSGNANTASGFKSMFKITSGSSNVAIGYQTTYSITTGSANDAIGYESMYSITVGDSNSALGQKSLYTNSTNNGNVGVGMFALEANTANDNTALGTRAFATNSTGILNTGIGYKSFLSNTTGNGNTGTGYYAGYSNITGDSNLVDGIYAAYTNSAGNGNIAVGSYALFNNTVNDNIAVGTNALYSNTTGPGNTAVGYKSLYSNYNATYNTAVGMYAGYSNYGGGDNTFIGAFAGLSNTGGNWNTFTGLDCGYANTTGVANSFYGKHAGFSNITGSYNCMFGNHSDVNGLYGDSNVYMGYTVAQNEQGNENVIVGFEACPYTSGSTYPTSLNVFVGARSANSYNYGNYNTVLGAEADLGGVVTDATAIGASSQAIANDQMELGNNNVTITMGRSGHAPTITPVSTRLELNTEYGAAPFNITAATASPVMSSGQGWSGLRFDDLTSNSTTSTNPGTGVLSLNAYGDVIYVPSGGSSGTGSFGVCSSLPALGADEGLNLATYNIYFTGNTSNYLNQNDVLIGYPCAAAAPAKLSVLQASNAPFLSTQSSIGLYVENDDLLNATAYTMGAPVIGIMSYVPLSPNGYCSSIAGYFSAPNNFSANCVNYAIVVPNNGGNSGFGTTTPGVPLQVDGTLYDSGFVYINAATGGAALEADQTNSGSGIDYGVVTLVSSSTGSNTGYYTYVTGASSSSNYGVYATAAGSSGQTNYGVYAQANANAGDWAGYFVGRVYSPYGTWVPSDSKLKTNIDSISNSNAASILSNLKPYSYIYDKVNHRAMGLPDGIHYGFLAQDLEKVLPNMVTNTYQPDVMDSTGKKVKYPGEDFKAVNYTEIIPILVKGYQDMQNKYTTQKTSFDSLKNVIQNMQNCLNQICSATNNGASVSQAKNATNVQDISLSSANAPLLYQNIPNPFSTGTKINYYLPQGTVGATVVFYDNYGNQIKQVQLTQTGNGTLNITPDNLSNGIYSYSLVINGNVIDTKRMVLQK